MFSILHLSDPRFGGDADLEKVAALVGLVPDLEPNLIVVSGDVTTHARVGEFQAARVWLRELERTAPTYVIPGDHDVQWWKRPLVPFGRAAQYRKFAQHFGPILAPTVKYGDAVVASILTAHGLAWRSLTNTPGDWATKGHVVRQEIDRVKQIFNEAAFEQARILVMHHNVLRGGASGDMGVTRWKQVHRWIIDTGADLLLCGHDHQHKTDVMGGIVVSCSGTISARVESNVPSSFHRIIVEGAAIQVEAYQWDPDRRLFRRTDVNAYARQRISDATAVAVGVV